MIEQQVHTKVTADASQANAEMGKFKKAIDDTGGAGTSLGQKVAKGLDSAVVALAKFNLAVGGVRAGIGLLHDGIDALRDVEAFHKLQAAVPVEVFERLDAATGRLFTKQQLLTVATKTLNADFKFTAGQMADVLNASRTLSERGYGPMEQIQEKLIKSVSKQGEGLDDFNLIIDKTKTGVERTNEVLAKLHGLAEDGSAVTDETRTIADMDRAFEDLAMTLKEDIVPILVQIVSLIHETIAGWDDMLGGIERRQAQLQRDKALADLERARTGSRFLGDVSAANDTQNQRDWLRTRGRETLSDAEYFSALQGDLGTPSSKWVGIAPQKSGSSAIPVYVVNAREVGEHTVEPWYTTGQGDFGAAAWDSSSLDVLEFQNANRMTDERQLANSANRRGLGQLRGQGSSFAGSGDLAAMADPLKQMKDDLADTSTVVGATYATLAAGMAAAVDAAITGGDSIVRAAAKASAGVLKSLAIEAIGKAGWYGVEALGYAIVGDAARATASAIAAGRYAAQAAALAGLAAGLGSLAGGGGGGSGGGVGSGGGYAATAGGGYAISGGGGGGGGHNITINIGGGVQDARQIANAVTEGLRQAERQGQRTTFGTTTFSG